MIGPARAMLRRELPVALFLLAGTAVFTVVGIARGQVFLWVYLPALVASVAIVIWIDSTRGPIPRFLLWLLAVWAVMHLAGGLAPNPTGTTDILYGMWFIDGIVRYDQVVHGFGIAVATTVIATAARDTARPLVWGFVWGQAIGLVNETAENVVAHFVEGSNVGDAVNTAWDLAWHVIGSSFAVALMAYRGVPSVQETQR